MLNFGNFGHDARKTAGYTVSEIRNDNTAVKRVEGDLGQAIPVDLRFGEIAVVVHLRDCPRQILSFEGDVLFDRQRITGQLDVLRAPGSWTIDLGGAIDCVVFSMPRDETSIGNQIVSFDAYDRVMLGLTRSLVISMSEPQSANTLFTQSVVSAIMFHISEIVAGSEDVPTGANELTT